VIIAEISSFTRDGTAGKNIKKSIAPESEQTV